MADSDEITKGLERAADRLEQASRNLGNSGNQSTITLNAGGLGVWVCVTCCAVMLACNVFMIGLYLDQQSHIRDLDAYLAAIYQQVPWMKPKEEAK